jgi:hypothetical protein
VFPGESNFVAYFDADTHCNVDTHGDTNFDTYTYGDSYPDTDTNRDVNVYAHSGWLRPLFPGQSDTDADFDADTYSDADCDPDPLADPNTHQRRCQGGDLRCAGGQRAN